MSIFDVLTMLGGLCLFLFGMTLMGQALERRAGGRLRSLLGKMTTGRLAGFFTGLGVTAVIQSSSATTVIWKFSRVASWSLVTHSGRVTLSNRTGRTTSPSGAATVSL
jgi:hypothetical protein